MRLDHSCFQVVMFTPYNVDFVPFGELLSKSLDFHIFVLIGIQIKEYFQDFDLLFSTKVFQKDSSHQRRWNEICDYFTFRVTQHSDGSNGHGTQRE